MWLAQIVCSHGDCIEEREVVVESLDELDRFGCECGYGFVVLSVAETSLVEIGAGEVVPIASRAAELPDSQRAAA